MTGVTWSGPAGAIVGIETPVHFLPVVGVQLPADLTHPRRVVHPQHEMGLITLLLRPRHTIIVRQLLDRAPDVSPELLGRLRRRGKSEVAIEIEQFATPVILENLGRCGERVDVFAGDVAFRQLLVQLWCLTQRRRTSGRPLSRTSRRLVGVSECVSGRPSTDRCGQQILAAGQLGFLRVEERADQANVREPRRKLARE
jgi:hypothetical protein